MMTFVFGLAAAVSLGAGAPAAIPSQQAAETPASSAQPAPAPGAVRQCVRTGAEPFDYAAREKQVASGDQRIQPLAPGQFTQDAQDVETQMNAFFGGREAGIPKTIGTMFKYPGLARSQMLLGLELNQHGKLPPREREMAILRTAWLERSPFEWGEHVRYGHAHGLTTEEIERITQGSSAQGWNEHDRAVLRGVEELLGDYAVSDATWATLAKTWDEQQLIELPGLVGSYTLTAMLYNSLRFGMVNGNPGFCAR
jgi:alkylhydroperoxidase family enzyme